METKTVAVTVNVAAPVTKPEAAVIVAAPIPTPVANPWLPAELLIVATAVVEELHVTEVVRFCVLLSE